MTSPERILDRLGPLAAPEVERAARRIHCDLDPVSAFDRLGHGRHPFLLDSADPSHPDGRFTILGTNPWGYLQAKNGRAQLFVGRRRVDFDHPLDALGALEATLRRPAPRRPAPELPFFGGAVGYLGYDLGRSIERLPALVVDDLEMDDLWLGLYDWALIRDHQEETWTLVATARHPEERTAEALLDEVERWLTPRLAGPPLGPPLDVLRAPVQATFTRDAYLAAVDRTLEHIAAGDIYQVNLSQRFDVEARLPPFELYRRLRERTHAVFSAYLDTPSARILSLSPERFLRVRGRQVETCPIKGTRPRAEDPGEDAVLARELVASAKDHAELSIIVDLERNDLGRVCEPGTVRVAEHAELYTLATVHHTVTRVTGQLRADVDIAALLRATFPGGSITGAPKIRSMEIIESLEPTRRGVYTGSVGYIDYTGDLDLNIAIRTVPVLCGTAYVQAGGGLVADSDPEAEYAETLDKARALLDGLGADPPSP